MGNHNSVKTDIKAVEPIRNLLITSSIKINHQEV